MSIHSLSSVTRIDRLQRLSGLRAAWPALLLSLFMALMAAQPARATDFEIIDASVHLEKGVYRVDAEIDYHLSGKPREALENGVPLILELEMQVIRKRAYLWDDTLASVLLRHRLSYRALSRRYQIENLSTGRMESFPSLNSAVRFLREVREFPLIDQSLLQADQSYVLALKARLDIESLPTPLRALAYVSPEWYLSSSWHKLPLTP
jgi:hypothetical protein